MLHGSFDETPASCLQLSFAQPRANTSCWLQEVLALADFLHAQGADYAQWCPITTYVRCNTTVEEALRFSVWPQALRGVCRTVMDNEFNGVDGRKLAGDGTVLERVTAGTVDVPGALAEWVREGEGRWASVSLSAQSAASDTELGHAVKHQHTMIRGDEHVMLDKMAEDNNNATWGEVSGTLVSYIRSKGISHNDVSYDWSHHMLEKIDGMPRDGSKSYRDMRMKILHACIPEIDV